MSNSDMTAALTTIIEALKPLNSVERHRTVEAAMVFLGETWKAASTQPRVGVIGNSKGPRTRSSLDKWMEKNSVSTEELDRVFYFIGDGSFDIRDVPGKSKRERTLNTYTLTGVGKFLATGKRTFDDAMARGFCGKLRCYDKANHSVYLKTKTSEFSGDKKTGYSLTNAGLKRGAALVKELSNADMIGSSRVLARPKTAQKRMKRARA